MSGDLTNRIVAFLDDPAIVRSTQSVPGIAIGTVKGPLRDDNQDRVVAAYISPQSGKALLVAIVCDGMGGMADGGRAATLAASTFISCLALSTGGKPSAKTLVDAVRQSDRAVFEALKGEGGTTLTAIVMIEPASGWIAHVGDSRAYDANSEFAIEQLTRDDTIAGLVGGEEADEKSRDNRLLQFVGQGGDLEAHIIPLKGMGRRFLLASDGVHGMGKKVLQAIASNSSSAADLVRKIVFVSDATGVDDNASAVALSIDDFVVPPSYPSGVALTLWSATNKLEIWLGGIQGRSTAPARQQTARIEKQATKAPAKKTQKRVKREVIGEQSPPPKPQLKIDFGSGEDEADD
ncbi:protein phosphatase 2C domain-containing protein [Mesorhizobium sp. CO1-1-7]|uniref:PP2C family protein-serine/threonine phosphatase n=1 Tax=Mesorhizobium sp. CO1-1-7 TaxID=2876632 RepID=UPI001CD102D9|nr:protein phosphatase 2C domain-containing protein [Mesorhizobium sp. CO1-1-7]MBZ9747238.1 protein phosphatase 2C domain-containing protein [Mesorhizobium sp. CO1-1-7]